MKTKTKFNNVGLDEFKDNLINKMFALNKKMFALNKKILREWENTLYIDSILMILFFISGFFLGVSLK